MILALCLGLLAGLTIPALADSAASSIQIYASVNEAGTADVTMTVRLRITETVNTLYFPLPLNAEDVRLNDGGANTTRGTSALQVKLGKDVTDYVGDHVLTFKFKLHNVVKMVEDKLTLELPLLSGFQYPVSSVSLTVMLPDIVEGRPVFKSTYHQQDIDTILSVSISNNMVTGSITQQLKDHETLTMTMVVPPEMFGGVSTYVRVGTPEAIPMAICGGLALLYWLIFLRCYPTLKIRRNSPPEGITAGELSSRLTMAGVDLTACVFSWAQMGYILIQLDDRGRVWLHKRMDMGNERSPFEVKTFRTLFARRDTVDGTGQRYADLAKKVASANPGRKTMCHPKCGNTKIFRGLMAGVSAFGGICYAMNFTDVVALQVILGIFLAAVGAVSGWLIQQGMYRLHLRDKQQLLAGIAGAAAWMGLGLWCGQWLVGLICILAQLLAGLMAAYGGRRSQLGRQNASQILGLRHYLKTVDRGELKRIQENDPEYFYNLLPFAMALGVDNAFAKRFGKKKLSACPYFTCGVKSKLTAEEWIPFFRETARILDERCKRMELDKYAAIWVRR